MGALFNTQSIYYTFKISFKNHLTEIGIGTIVISTLQMRFTGFYYILVVYGKYTMVPKHSASEVYIASPSPAPLPPKNRVKYCTLA